MVTKNKRGLGRGLESLLSAEASSATGAAALHELDIGELRPSRYQPRQDIDDEALEALAQSIRAQGVVQPLVVRADDTGYEIVAGERRWRAAKRAGLTQVPAVVRATADDAAMAIALIENIQREDLDPIEESNALARLITECGLTHAACAEAVGRSRAAVSNLLRLGELTTAASACLREGRIEMGHARALLGLTGEAQAKAADSVVARDLTVRQTEALVRELQNQAEPSAEASQPAGDSRSARLAARLRDRLAMDVRVAANKRGGGRVTIRFADAAELEALIERLGSGD